MKKLNLLNRRSFIRQSSALAAGTIAAGPVISQITACTRPASEINIRHVMAAGEEGRFMGHPANLGSWSWDDGRELLVAHSDITWAPQWSHNVGPGPSSIKLARSLDGGYSWTSEDAGFSGVDRPSQPSPGDIEYGHPDFAMIIQQIPEDLGNNQKGFFISYDRGKRWQGPYIFNQLWEDPNLREKEDTTRTCYLVTGRNSVQYILSATNPEWEESWRRDKPFVVESNDGGKTFKFISWVVPLSNRNRAVMPSAVRTPEGNIIVAVRCRNPFDIQQSCWVDCYISRDNGRTWSFQGRVADTGLWNGSSGALALLEDGRLACCYGNRNVRRMRGRVSSDSGVTWGEEIDLTDEAWEADLGYPQMIRNHKGELVSVYYIATRERRHSFIEAAIWKP